MVYISSLMLSLPPTVETRQTSPFSLTTPTQTRSTRWPCYCSICCVLGKSSGRATEHILRCRCRPTSYQNSIPKNVSKNRRKSGIWYIVHHTSIRRVRVPALSTAANNVLGYSTRNRNSSAWNHVFNFQRRGPCRRRARKLLSLCHTHGEKCTKEPITALPSNG